MKYKMHLVERGCQTGLRIGVNTSRLSFHINQRLPKANTVLERYSPLGRRMVEGKSG